MRAPPLKVLLGVAAVLSSLVVWAGCRNVDPPSHANAAPPAPAVDCDRGGRAEPLNEAREQGLAAGPLLFAYARQLAEQSWIVRPQDQLLRELIDDPDTPAAAKRRARRTLRAMPPDGHGIAHVIVFVKAGETVTVALPQHERDQAALVYTRETADRERPGAAAILPISDGDAAVTFRACADRTTHWNGGLLVAGRPRCLPLDLWVAGRGEPLHAQLPIGTGERCPQ
jgi:hypothetical protein